jgi:hypothetical protein
MVENKWQHFVPQFYFRFFSEDSENIRGHHLRSGKHYKDKILNQSAKDYFYSKNIQIEKSFIPLESKFNAVLSKIIENEEFRVLTEEEYLEMLRFITFQGSRTEKAKLLADDFIDKISEKIMKPIMKADKELMKKVTEKDLDKVRLVYPGAFLYGVIHSLESNILLTDLVPAVVINNTEDDFIFSDNPVVFYNLVYRDPSHAFEGNQHPGLIIFCPISPTKCLLLYDPVYYSIELVRNMININDKKDIKAINKLQFHSCLNNVYYKSESQRDYVDSLSKEYSSKYQKSKDLAQIKEVQKWDGGNNSLLVTSKKGIPEKIDLQFIKCAKPLSSVCVVRNKELTELFNEKMKLYESERNPKQI